MSDKLIKLFKEYVWTPDDYTEICWSEDVDELTYNTDNDIDALMNGDGNTYSGRIKSYVELDGYVLLTIDSEQGWDYQAFFSVDKKVDANKYWDEQEEDEDE